MPDEIEPGATPETQDAVSGEGAKPDALGDAGKAAIDRMKADRDAAKKALKDMQRELEQLRTATASDTEKALAEAKNTGRAEVLTSLGSRLVRAELVAAAARRNASFDPAPLLDDLNLTKYVDEAGEIDTDGVKALAEKIVPAPAADPRPRGNVGLGPRPGNGTPLNPKLADLAQIEADLAASRRT